MKIILDSFQTYAMMLNVTNLFVLSFFFVLFGVYGPFTNVAVMSSCFLNGWERKEIERRDEREKKM